MTITEFLMARLDEDAAAASRIFDLLPSGREMGLGPLEPARVLAEVVAKRRIAALHDGRHECVEYGVPGDTTFIDLVTECHTLRALSLPYADHPDHRQEWKP